MIKIKTKKDEFYHFDKISHDWWNEEGEFKALHKIRPLRIRYILDQLESEKLNNISFLDIGCGGGLVCESISKLGGKITGIDFVKNNIKVAKKHALKNNLKINYICKDIEKENYIKKFDIIIMYEVLEHLDNWPKFIKKIKKNLNKNGTLILSTLNRNLKSKYLSIIIAENLLRWIPKGTHDYNKFIKPKEIEKVFKNEGFKITNFRGLIFNPIKWEWTFSQNTDVNYFCTAKIIN